MTQVNFNTSKKLRMILSVISCCTLIASCTKSDNTTTGNPFVSLKVQADTQQSSAGLAKVTAQSIEDSTGAAVTISKLWANIGGIEFEAPERPDEDGQRRDEFEGPYVVNLLDASSDPVAQKKLSIDSIQSVRIEYVAATSLPSGAPSELLDNTFYMEASVGGRNFSFALEDNLDFTKTVSNAKDLEDGSTLLLELQVADVLSKIDLSSVTNGDVINSDNRVSAANPCPLIDDSSSDIYTCFEKGFKIESLFGEDVNDDGDLDENDDGFEED